MAIKKNKCIVVGSGQFCNFIIQIIEDIKEIDCIGYLSENKKKNNKIKNYKCIGDDTYLQNNKTLYDSVFPAIGNLKIRKKIISKILKYKKQITSIKHPSAIQSKSAKFKDSSLMTNSFLSNNVKIGKYSVIGTGSYIHHDTVIGQNCLIGGGAQIGASVTVEDNVLFGIGSVVASKSITIGCNSIIAAGTVVLENIPKNSLVLGNPGRVIKRI